MQEPAESICELGIMELGTARLAFFPNDGRPLIGKVPVPPADGDRYAWVEDDIVVLYREEEDVAGLLNLEIEQGATFTYLFRWKNTDGSPVDLTGATAKMQIRAAKSTTADHKATLASYAAGVGDPAPWFVAIDILEEEGQVSIYLTPVETPTIPAGDWWYDLNLYLTSGDVYRLVEGQVTVDPGVTA